MTEWTTSVSREIATDPMTIWNAISDVTRMGEWSPECQECTWDEGFSGPEIGAVFTGVNRNGEFEWTTQAKVTVAEPGQSFAFDAMARDFVFAKWRYDLEAIEGGTRVSEHTLDLRPDAIKDRGAAISGTEDRDARNRETMEATLARLADALEG
ncbi:MAG: SRPBCC family protein [Actinomycetota bacterium]